MLREFVARAREAGFGTRKILAVHSDNSQDRLLAASGFTHAIPEPLDTAELRSTVLDLVEYVSADYAPVAKAGSPQARPDNMEDIQKRLWTWTGRKMSDSLFYRKSRAKASRIGWKRPGPAWMRSRTGPSCPDAIWQEADGEAPAAEQPIFTEESLKRSLPRKPDKRKDQRRTWRLAPLMP